MTRLSLFSFACMGPVTDFRNSSLPLITTFTLSFKGLNLVGMLSHVFRPMMTAFTLPSGAAVVTRAKYAISCGRRHGRRALWPIPFASVAATMRVIEAIRRKTGGHRVNQSGCLFSIGKLRTNKFFGAFAKLQAMIGAPVQTFARKSLAISQWLKKNDISINLLLIIIDAGNN